MRRPILALFIAPAIVAAVNAAAASSMPSYPQPMSPSAKACEAARLASWFEAQRQLTDGDADPTKPIATPEECIRSDGRATGKIDSMNARDSHMPATLQESKG
jgi:hypothetical protein